MKPHINNNWFVMLAASLLLCGGGVAQTNSKNNASTVTNNKSVVKKNTANSTAPKKNEATPAIKIPGHKKAISKPKPAPTPTVTVKNEYDYDYKNAIGLRIGQTTGITFKHFCTENCAAEAIVGLWPNAIGLTGLYEKYVPAGSIDGFHWYFGGGAHVSVGTGRLYTVYQEGRYLSYRSKYPGVGLGIDGIVGAEYKIPSIPFAVSFDIKPFVEVNSTGVIFAAFDPGLGIKVTF